MAGIAGVALPHSHDIVEQMLRTIGHRGNGGLEILNIDGYTFGIVWTHPHIELAQRLVCDHVLCEEAAEGQGVTARIVDGTLKLKRDRFGIAPLYYTHTDDGALCFASEVKALIPFSKTIRELPPGMETDGREQSTYFQLEQQPPLSDSPTRMAAELRTRLEDSVKKHIRGEVMGAWLSGGLDSSAMAALARRHLKILHTFSIGMHGAPDLEYALEVAKAIETHHHEIVVGIDEVLRVLPDVIYHLESFDALLVRSSVTNYLVAKLASEFVTDVFSGEGGDELFGGYHYLKDLDGADLPAELVDITKRLHNTALQRVDRCASAHGTVAHVGFLDPGVVDYALRIPAEFKIHDEEEKWILREALHDALPHNILRRRKVKFWEGAGVGDALAHHADAAVSDDDFRRERVLANGWTLNSKEELNYYRVFAQHFGSIDDLSWMGRTKGVPVEEP